MHCAAAAAKVWCVEKEAGEGMCSMDCVLQVLCGAWAAASKPAACFGFYVFKQMSLRALKYKGFSSYILSFKERLQRAEK